MDRPDRILFALLRAGLCDETTGEETCSDFAALLDEGVCDWAAVYQQASAQGVLAVAWDGLMRLTAVAAFAPESLPPRVLKLQWGCNVGLIEQNYARQKALIEKLAAFYRAHGFPMMLLKGYGLSRCYPVPEHRPCGDIDIWLYGKQRQADAALYREKGIDIDPDKHHHTVFAVDGIVVENHYDFLNVHSHRSNRELEKILRRLILQSAQTESVGEERIFLPPAQFNALFLLRHAAGHFAAAEIGLRHIADWALFVRNYSGRIDWPALESTAREMNMHRFLHCLNAIAIDCLGLDPASLPPFEREQVLEKRVMNEILHPAFAQKLPEKGTFAATLLFKYRRWNKNRWKHRIVYREGVRSAFFQLLWSHILKPKSFGN